MCRIAGIVDRNSSQITRDCISMRDSMKHGGPDDAGFYIDKEVSLAFGHRRLSIIDLSNLGNQPMFNEDRDLVVIFNGEIYNYMLLKDELVSLGFQFKTHSDTEVILKAYEHWGTDCFCRFRGMFAIALYDRRNGELVLARDHAGIKPLYYYCDKDSLYFASEIRGFKQIKNKWDENPDWKVFFLTYGYLPHPVTTLKGVKPLEKGSVLQFNIQTLQSKQLFFFRDTFTEEITSLEEAGELVRQSLENSVERHMISDAPIGLFLSGGIDSSLLTLLAKQHKKNKLHTLSIYFDEKNYSEKKYQDIIVNKVQSRHQAFLLKKELFIIVLPDILTAMDQPSSDGINSYFISMFAKEAGLKAVLSGLGADELFGGYPSFRPATGVGVIKKLPDFFYNVAALLPRDKYKKIGFLKRKDPLGEYLFNRGYFIPSETARLLGRNTKEVNSLLSEITVPPAVTAMTEGNRVSYLESNFYMQDQLLKDTDAMSMWHGVEVRVPFLDYDLVKTVQKISSVIKFGNKQSKFLLIDSFREILPREIWDRKKQGFVFPFDVWMKDKMQSIGAGKQNKNLSKRFEAGKLAWSRYWTYQISQAHSA